MLSEDELLVDESPRLQLNRKLSLNDPGMFGSLLVLIKAIVDPLEIETEEEVKFACGARGMTCDKFAAPLMLALYVTFNTVIVPEVIWLLVIVAFCRLAKEKLEFVRLLAVMFDLLIVLLVIVVFETLLKVTMLSIIVLDPLIVDPVRLLGSTKLSVNVQLVATIFLTTLLITMQSLSCELLIVLFVDDTLVSVAFVLLVRLREDEVIVLFVPLTLRSVLLVTNDLVKLVPIRVELVSVPLIKSELVMLFVPLNTDPSRMFCVV